jgi:SAM-dependent methyltransferase
MAIPSAELCVNEMKEDIDKINSDFYNQSGSSFDTIPFQPFLPELLLKYLNGHQILEIGSGPGALALWLKNLGYQITYLEPAKKLAEVATQKGLDVRPLTIQEFETSSQYDCIIAISSLIHVPKKELPFQIKKIANLLYHARLGLVNFEGSQNDPDLDDREEGNIASILPTNDRSKMGRFDGPKNSPNLTERGIKPQGIFFVSFIEGEGEGFEDPTKLGKLRYFAKWSEAEIDYLLSPSFTLLKSHRIHNHKMDRTFLLNVYRLTLPFS